MAQSETVIEGTWEQLECHSDALRGKRLRLTVISEVPAVIESNGTGAEANPQTLAEFLGDCIGSVEGSGNANSEK